MATQNNFDDTIPVQLELPDGDVAMLITWAFVNKKLDEELQPIISEIGMINIDLQRIIDRVDYWLSEQSEDDD